MKVRSKKDGTIGSSNRFNIHAVWEIYVQFDDEEVDDYPSNYDVLLPDGQWKDLDQAFHDHDVIPDNYNTNFREPHNEEERKRGWY